MNFWNSGDNQWQPLSSSFNGDPDFGPEVSFGYQMRAAFPGDNIYLYKYAVPSTSLYFEWNPIDPGNSLPCYSIFQSGATAALQSLQNAGLSPTIAGMLWMQGESDAANPYYAAAYQTNLMNLIAAVRGDFNTPDMPFVIGRITTAWGDPVDNAIVRAAQMTVPTLVNNASWINTDDLEISTAIPPHYGTQGQIDLGLRFANQFIQAPEPSVLALVADRRDRSIRLCLAKAEMIVYPGYRISDWKDTGLMRRHCGAFHWKSAIRNPRSMGFISVGALCQGLTRVFLRFG